MSQLKKNTIRVVHSLNLLLLIVFSIVYFFINIRNYASKLKYNTIDYYLTYTLFVVTFLITLILIFKIMRKVAVQQFASLYTLQDYVKGMLVSISLWLIVPYVQLLDISIIENFQSLMLTGKYLYFLLNLILRTMFLFVFYYYGIRKWV
jgi:hypothetical protein